MITVNSGFDGGAISVISAESADNIQLQINTDNQSCTRQWFYFSVGTTRARQQTIRLINASQSSFAEAWHGYQAFASYDNEHWFRVDTRYQQGELVLTHQSSEKLVYYAYFVPYSASRETRLLQELSEHSVVNLTKLGKTPLGRDITLIRIGSLQSGARKVWLMARQHPGETIHSYSQFCENYRRYALRLKRLMRQIHRAGEKLFIDFAGPTVQLTDGSRVLAPIEY